MSGVIGAVSNKFIIIAATLMVPVTVNHHIARGAIDPALKTSTISPELAARFHLDGAEVPSSPAAPKRRTKLNIGMGAENFDISGVAIGRDPCCADRDFVMGQDVLAEHVFEIDFVHRTIRLVLPFEYHRATQHLQSIVLSRGSDGSRLLPLQIGASPPIQGTLDLAEPDALKIDRRALSGDPSLISGERRPVRSGDAAIGDLDVGIGDGGPAQAQAVIGMGAFSGSRIILDLPHDRIWIARKS